MCNQDLTAKIRELKELKALSDDLSNEIAAVEDSIKQEMTARNAEEIRVDVYCIRWKPVTSRRLDTKALRLELPEIAARYTKTTESKRFTIQ